MKKIIIARALLLISLIILIVMWIFHLDSRNVWAAYIMAIASALFHFPWRLRKLLKNQDLHFIGNMPGMPEIFIYEILFKVHDSVRKRTTTQRIKIPTGGEQWRAMCIIDDKFVDEYGPDEKSAVALIIAKIKAVK